MSTKVMEVIKYKVYRGHLEPVTEINKSQINLYENYLESIQDYTFEGYKLEPDDVPYRKFATLLPAAGLAVELTESWHEHDPEKKAYPCIHLLSTSYQDLIRVETFDEAYEIYDKLKKWLNA
jgi:hypothetical protein